MKPRTIQLFNLLGLLLPLLAAAETLSGRVVKVVDGNTVHVLDNAKERHKIRLQGIDAPERKPGFRQALEGVSIWLGGR